LLGLHERHEIVRRRARAEQQRLPAVGLEEVGDHARAEHVLLLRRPGDDREPPVARRAPQLPAEAVEDGLGHSGRVVLLGDVQRAHRPAMPDFAQRRLEHAEIDVRHGDSGLERVLDHAAGAGGVAAQQGVQERGTGVVEAQRRSGCQPNPRPPVGINSPGAGVAFDL
jgi:hypothetical protein